MAAGVPGPTRASYTDQQGKTICDYIVFRRTYTQALLLMHPKDFWNCTNYGDETGGNDPPTETDAAFEEEMV